MPVAILVQSGFSDVRKAMKVPKRPEQLDKWFKEAVKAFGDKWPADLSSNTSRAPMVGIEEIQWEWRNSEGFTVALLIIDRMASGLSS